MKTLYTFLFSVLTLVVCAQSGHYGGQGGESPKIGVITGKVVDKELATPLEFSNVVVYSARDSSIVNGAIANEEGAFRVTELPFGKFYVVVNFIGFEKHTINEVRIFLQQTEVDLGTVSLQPASQVLEELIVEGQRSNVEYHVDRKVINVSSNIMAAGGNAIDVLETAPSIQVDIEGNVILRGSSSFTVLIDGKPTVLEPSDVLEQIPASTIENIEIITNPSAKFDPDGVAGIINIVMKKKKKNSNTGVINGMIGTNEKYRTDFLFSVQRKKIDFFIGGDIQDRTYNMLSESYRISDLNDTTIRLDSDGKGNFQRYGQGLRFGAGYQFNEAHKLSFSSQFGAYNFGRSSFTDQVQFTDPPGETVLFDNSNSFRRESNYYRTDLTWDWDINKNTNLVTYIFVSGRDGGNRNTQESIDTDPDGNIIGQQPYFTRIIEDNVSDDFRYKMDLTTKYENENVLEAGYQLRRDHDQEDYLFYEKADPNAEWPADPSFTNSTDYTRNIHGAYVTFQGKTSFLEYKAGLRSEYTDRSLLNKGANVESTINRIDFFPSFHIGREIKEKQEIYASYTRRINRPRSWYLDPFVYFIDQYNIRVGNPDLEPEYIDSYELGTIREFEKSYLSVETYYRVTNNMITRIQTLEDDGYYYHTADNINRDHALGVEVNWNWDPAKWISLNLSGSLYNYRIEGELEGNSIDQSSTNVDGRFNASFKAGKNTRFQVNSFFRGPSVNTQGDSRGMWAMNLSARQDFMKKKMSATLQVRDIFDTMNFRSTSNGENFTSGSYHDRESQIFMLTLSYKINNYREDRRRNGNGSESGGDDGYDEGI